MSLAPRRKTEFLKTTLAQELRLILGPENPLPPSPKAYRRVVIMVPPTPACVYSLDHPSPEEAGPNRTYDLPIIQAPRTHEITVGSSQRLYAACRAGMAEAALIVEYVEED